MRPPLRSARARTADSAAVGADELRVIVPIVDAAISSPLSAVPPITTADRSDPSTAPTMISTPAPAVGSPDDRTDSLPLRHAGTTAPQGTRPARHSRNQSCPVNRADHLAVPQFRRISERRQTSENMPPHELGRSIPAGIASRAERSRVATQGRHKPQLLFYGSVP